MPKIVLYCLLLLCWGCGLPEPVRLSHFVHFSQVQYTEDSLYLSVKKDIPGPVHFYLSSRLPAVDTILKQQNPLVLTEERLEQQLRFPHQVADTSLLLSSIHGSTKYGDPFAVWDTSLRYAWPFPKGKSYKIIQGYDGSFSHNEEGSRYAIDFSLAMGDTICAAQDGLVVSVLQKNTIGGAADRRYRDYANVITLFHKDGLYSQYAHLKTNSAMVRVGDRVKKGQAIALAGMTGFTSIPHLHFNVRKPVIGDAISTPVVFEQLSGTDLKKGMQVSH